MIGVRVSGMAYRVPKAGRYNEATDEARQDRETDDRCNDPEEAEQVTREHRIGLLKTVPGLLISAFFLWWTFFHRHKDGTRGFDPKAFRAIHLSSPLWIAAVIGLTVLGYGLRCFRWWWMLRNTGAKFWTCTRVLMTSLAANNFLPLRIGDIMRVFTYAPDLNATPSSVLSTVILEKLLDVFTLAVLFVVALQFGDASPHWKWASEVCVAASTVGLLVLVFGARRLHAPVSRMAERTKSKILAKVEHWLSLAIDCIEKIGVGGTLLLIVYSFAAWGCEGLMYSAMAKLIGLQVNWVGPWQAVTEANLSFLIPSSPGGIGPFEAACKDAMTRVHVAPASGVVFGTVIHLWLLVALTGVGGAMFLAHRFGRGVRKPLIEEIDTLPAKLP
jgi:glycosyltransferase 2 family protein